MAFSLLITGVLDPRRRALILGTAVVLVLVAGVFAENLAGYLCIAMPALLPLVLWLRTDTRSVPILPLISGIFFIYYGIPVLRNEVRNFTPDEVFAAAVTAGSFITAAALTCWPFLHFTRGISSRYGRNIMSDNQIVGLVFAGFAGGILYYIALLSGTLDWLGSLLGLLRSIVLTLTSIACYLLGFARAARLLRGGGWALALACMAILLTLSFSNLLLVGGIMNLLAAFLGYLITARRIPWTSMALAFALISILHAGKFEMRNRYWLPQTQSLVESSVAQVPGMMADWIVAGVAALSNGEAETDVLERASLLHMLLLVQRATPSYIPYLNGETYALLPSMLLPRFVDPNKIESQAGLNLLSVRYGLQSAESTGSTTIGWGLIAEAYANFGFWGVVAIGAAFGAVCGFFMWLSVGAHANSVPMFLTIAGTLVLFNLEADLSYLAITLLQTLAAVLILGMALKLVDLIRSSALPAAAGPPIGGSPFGELRS